MSDRESSPERNVKEGTPNGSADSYSPERRHKRPSSRSKSGSRDRDRDRSRSYSPKRGRQRSRSPGSNRRRHQGDRDNPTATRCLGVFGLSLYTQTRHLRDVFSKYGNIDEITIVTDAQGHRRKMPKFVFSNSLNKSGAELEKFVLSQYISDISAALVVELTGRSRGFSFVYFENIDDAKRAKEDCNGIEIDNRKIRVDFSITKRPHTPTPGIYMGRPSQFPRRSRGRRGSGGYGGGGHGGGYDRYDDRRDYGRREDYGRRDDYYRDDYRRDDYRRSPSPYYGGGGGGGGGRRSSYRRSRSRSYSPRREYDGGRYRY